MYNKIRPCFVYIILLCVCYNPVSLFSQDAEYNQLTYDYAITDSVLNSKVELIVQKYADDSLFVINFIKAHELWLDLRDAELKTRFPEYKDLEYGSIHSYCTLDLMLKLTRQRIKHIQIWIDGYEEGDACNGSIK